MNFYQQKYFKPYHKIVAQHRPAPNSHHKEPEYQSFERTRERTASQAANEGFQRSPFKHIQVQRIAEPIWDHLYSQGLKSQKQLLERHQNSKNKIDVECTFKPILRQNKRYLANSSSSFLERVNIWQEHKLEKMIREKEEEVNKDLKECTFAPVINDIPRRHDNMDTSQTKSPTKQTKNRNLNPFYSPIRQKTASRVATSPKKQQKVELSFAKSMIRSELRRIAI